MDRSVAAPGRDAKAAREWDGRCVQCLAGTALRQGLGFASREQLAALAPLIRRFAPPRSAPRPCEARRALRPARAHGSPPARLHSASWRWAFGDRSSTVEGKGASWSLDLGGLRIIKKKKKI